MNELKIPSKHTLVLMGKYPVLHRDGTPVLCPKIQPYMEPDNMGGAKVSRGYCGNHCPFFQTDTKEGKPIAKIACGSIGVMYPIEHAEPVESGKILQL